MNSAPSASQYHEHDVVPEWPRTPRASGILNSGRRSIGRRMSRAFARYSVVFLIGIGVTLTWQSYGDEAIEMAKVEAPSLAWLLPVSTVKTPPDGQGSPAAAASSPQLVQQLEPTELGLVAVRRRVEQLATKVEQLAAKQDQIAQNIATLQSVEQEVSQRMSSLPRSRAVPRKPPQPTTQSSSVPSVSSSSPTGQPSHSP